MIPRYSHTPLPTLAILVLGILAGAAGRMDAQTWQRLSPPATAPLPTLTAVHFTTASKGYVCGERSGAGVLYVTTDAGAGWSPVPLPGSPGALYDVHFSSPSVGVVAGANSYVAVTIDGGATWLDRSVPGSIWTAGGNIQGIYFKDANIGFVVGRALSGSGPRMARTANGGVTWTNVAMSGAANNLYDVDFFDANTGVAVGTGNPPRKSSSTDGGTTWETNGTLGLGTPPSMSFYSVDALEGSRTAYTAGGMVVETNYPEVRRSVNGGESWQLTATQPSGNKTLYGVLAVTPSLVYVSGRAGTIHCTTDGGATWSLEPLSPTTSYDLRRFTRSPDNQMYVVGEGGIIYRKPIVADAVFRTTSLDFEGLCPGGRRDLAFTVGNSGGIPLVIDSIIVAQPAQPGITYSIVSYPDTVRPEESGEVIVRAEAIAGTPGMRPASLWVYNSDESYTGADRNRQIALTSRLDSGTLAVAAGPFEAAPTRVGFDQPFTLADVLTGTGNCPVAITSVRLARGADFQITVPFLTSVDAGRKEGIHLLFSPKSPCARYDTVIIIHDGTSPASPIRVPVSGIGLAKSFSTIPADTLDFGGVLVNTGRDAELLLANKNLADECLEETRIRGFRIIGADAADFSTTFSLAQGQQIPIPPGIELPITITAKPGIEGQRVARAVIEHDARPGSADTVVLIVNGLQPKLTSASPEIRFALTDIDGRRDSIVTDFIVNFSEASADVTAVRIVGTNAADFRYDGPTPPTTIPAGARQTIRVSFRPTGNGLRTATLELVTTASSTPLAVRLTGNAARAVGGVRNPSIIFSSTEAGTCRDTVVRTFIYNLGSAPLRIANARITASPSGTPDDPSAFTLLSPVIPPELVIPARDSVSVQLRFCPLEARAYYAQLVLDNNTENGSWAIELIGSARVGSIGITDSVVFPGIRVLTTLDSVLERFIVNNGDAPLRIDSIAITGADVESFAYLSPATPFTIAPRGEAAASLRFTPKRRGRHRASLLIHTPAGTLATSLRGIALYPFLEIAPENISSLRVRVNTTQRIRINITNRNDESSDSALIENAMTSGSPAFTSAGSIPLPATLAPGESVAILVDFAPEQLCEHDLELRLRGQGVRGIYDMADTLVYITGIGTLPMVGSRHSEISFGLRPIGSISDTTLDDFLGNIDFSGMQGHCIEPTTIDSIVISGPGAASFTLMAPADPLQPRPLAADAFQPLTIRFAPASGGARTADLLVYFDGSRDSVHRVRLFGASSGMPVVYGPFDNMIAIDFGGVRTGATRDSAFTITNISDTALTIDELRTTLPAEMSLIAPSTPFTLLPNEPQTIGVRFAPEALQAYLAQVVIGSRGIADSSFSLIGAGVRDALRAEADTIDFMVRPPGTAADTVVLLINLPSADVPDAAFLGAATIDTAVMITGADFYEIVSHPGTVTPSGTAPLALRFNPHGIFARRTGIVRIFHGGHIEGGRMVYDSLDILLTGIVDGERFGVNAALGSDLVGSPGNVVEIPLTLEGEVNAAEFREFHVRLGFARTVLKPLRLIPVQPGIVAIEELPAGGMGRAGESSFSVVTTSGTFSPGTIARVAFLILLPDTLETTVRIDTAGVPERPDILFTTDSVRFTISEFCDAGRRLVTFDSLLSFASKPNPAARATHFEYTLPAATDVHLSIYDNGGHEVARPVDGPHRPGHYSLPFDASSLPTGTYYCILTAGRFSRTLILRILE